MPAPYEQPRRGPGYCPDRGPAVGAGTAGEAASRRRGQRAGARQVTAVRPSAARAASGSAAQARGSCPSGRPRSAVAFRPAPVAQCAEEVSAAGGSVRYPFTRHWALRFSATARPELTATGPCLTANSDGRTGAGTGMLTPDLGLFAAPGEAVALAED
ncbi:DUF6193 family natural product biosynthesis protein [Streptomyces ardesiacus]|uniref:DUF6193 family natural product biosynthesis protein n=1 Tax=Streptomyces ardesiacus TaxID=285564 RepID=UPI00364A6A70